MKTAAQELTEYVDQLKKLLDQSAMIKREIKQAAIEGCKNVLIIGASTGYGLASRIVAAFGRAWDPLFYY